MVIICIKIAIHSYSSSPGDRYRLVYLVPAFFFLVEAMAFWILEQRVFA